MADEVKMHVDNKHWEIIPREQVPKGTKVLPAVWAMRRKRRLGTNEVYKHKSRLNVHGGKQEYGVNYWETYSPVVKWISLRLMLILSIMNSWHTKQIDFVMAYPQAPIECPMYMEIPQGFKTTEEEKVLKLNKNLYGQKQAGKVWNTYLTEILINKMKMKQSQIDPCVFYRNKLIFMVYVDDGIITGPDLKEISEFTKELKQNKLNITEMGDLSEYLGVDIKKTSERSWLLAQTHLIENIIEQVEFKENTKPKSTPAPAATNFQSPKVSSKKYRWKYRSVVGKLIYLAACTRPDIAYASHQCARFTESPEAKDYLAVIHLVRYLKGTKHQGIEIKTRNKIQRSNKGRSSPSPKSNDVECWVDADYVGNYGRKEDLQHPDTARSRTGYLIQYQGSPVLWTSKLQTEIALSTTEAEYVALSEAMRDVIPFLGLLKEIDLQHGNQPTMTSNIKCKLFEDNSGAVEMCRVPKIRPRTKHILVKYHHFREAVRNGTVEVEQVTTDKQVADILTKALPKLTFERLRRLLSGW